MTFLDRIESYVGTSAFNPIEIFGIVAGEGQLTAEDLSEAKYHLLLSQYIREGVVDVVEKTLALNPKDLHLFCQNLTIRPMAWWSTEDVAYEDYFIPFKDADGGYHIKNNHILWVGREFGAITVPCHEITPEKALRIQDPESIYFTGVDYRNPVFYRSSSKVYIVPEVSSTDSASASALLYDDSVNTQSEHIKYFPSHLYHLVAMYAAIRALKISAHQKRREYEKFNTPLKVWSELYEGSLPTVPSFPSLPDFGDGFDLDYSFGNEASNMQDVFNLLWNRIHDEEDVELAGAEVARFNALMQEFQNKLGSLTTRQQNQLTAFTGALSDFNSKWDTMLKIWTQRVQSYTTEMSLLKNDIQELQAQYNQSFFPKAVEDKKEKEIQG